MVWYGLMDFAPSLVHESEIPLYRQLYQQFAGKIVREICPVGNACQPLANWLVFLD